MHQLTESSLVYSVSEGAQFHINRSRNTMSQNPIRVLVPDISHLRFPRDDEQSNIVNFLLGKTMGTTWHCSVVVPFELQQTEVEGLINDSLQIVVEQMSHWDPNSCLSQFNRLPAGAWQELPPEFFFVLEASLLLAEKTGGIYDPTIGEVINRLGFGPEKPASMSCKLEELALIREKCGYDKIEIESTRKRVRQPGDVRLDLSSIAKGFAVDLVADRLLNTGISNFLFEIGGEFRGEGCKPDGNPWWVEIEQPKELQQSFVSGRGSRVRIAACGLSIASSGQTYQSYQLPTGETISHLVNAKSCNARTSELSSVTVIDHSCMQADGWATALFVAGLESGLKLAAENQVAAIFTTRLNHNYESPMVGLLFD